MSFLINVSRTDFFFSIFFTGVLIEPQLAEWYEAEDCAWCPAGMLSDPVCPPEGNKNVLNFSFFPREIVCFSQMN